MASIAWSAIWSQPVCRLRCNESGSTVNQVGVVANWSVLTFSKPVSAVSETALDDLEREMLAGECQGEEYKLSSLSYQLSRAHSGTNHLTNLNSITQVT